ncbi:phage tail spike protein [Leuconostoc citreum]|uniref:phage tail spike protein n=1 Tax=Leuconostoc citreum TaxID=33964 RepID=UPI0021A7A960|nr:phage tail spike protein [Leuconostoc citreum]MCT3078285.1 hypothetical protein [Leuconostoc citreum]MCT3080418.1 hypothetical protein [Leuconostoc citreum]MCT3082845.1 hypothetical protein [Leuconostoc citreum]
MIYIFDKTQAIIKVLTNDDFTAAHLNFKINTATTFEFSLPASKALPSGSKYVATPHPLDDSKFIMLRLTERVDKTETIDYSAYELAYQELATDGYIEDKRPQNQSALNLMKIALDGSNWELNNVNVSGTATTNFYYVDRLNAISKVVDLLGGEIVFYIEIQGNAISGRYMDYLARQGADTSKVFASGSNLLTVERQSDTSGIYTAILPRGKGKEIDNGEADTPDGYGRRINIADVEWKKSAGKPLDKPKGSIVLSDPDATGEWGQINGNARLLLQTYDDIDDVNVLINSAYKTLQSVNHPQIQYSATVADVGGLSLGDTVLIMHGDRDLSYKTRVFEVKYDLLSPDQTELSLGDDLSSNSITSQINSLNAVADTTSSQTQWTISQIGRPGTTYGATAPDSPKVGDIWFKYLADGGTEIYRWNGDIWELLASPTTADDIAASVDDAVTQAKDYSDKAIADNQVKIDESIKSVDDKANQLKQDQSGLDTKAQGYANQAKIDAITNTTQAVKETLDNSQKALDQAKTDLTNGIAKETADRQSAVNALDTKAQGYANQAKSDAISAATTADGVINKKIDDTASSITTTISQNKTDANGKIATAQSMAQQAVDGLTLKVSKTDYDQKTGDLSTKINDVKETADKSAQTIADIKTADGKQDARMSEIENTASGLKSTVSDISTEQGKQSGYISTLQQRADGFDATVTKVNNLSVGGRNLLLGTSVGITGVGTNSTNANFDAQGGKYYLAGGKKVSDLYNQYGSSEYLTISFDWVASGSTISGTFNPQWDNSPWGGLSESDIKPSSTNTSGHFEWTVGLGTTGYSTGIAEAVMFRQDNLQGNITISNLKLELGNVPTDWTPAPEDVDSATAKAQLTADQATLSINNYKTDADGRISKAQADIITNANAITQKVSQTDYNAKTGDLSTKVSTAQQTADQANTTIGNYQKSNDGRVSSAESAIKQNTTNISSKVSQGDYNTKTGQIDANISQVNQKADSISQTVSQVSGKLDNLKVGGRNLLLGTQGWTGSVWENYTGIPVDPNNTYNALVIAETSSAWNSPKYKPQSIADRGLWVGDKDYVFSAYVRNTSDTDVIVYPFADLSNIAFTPSNTANSIKAHSDWTRVSTILHVNNQVDLNNPLRWESDTSVTTGKIQFAGYKLEEGNILTDWSPAPEDTDTKFSQQQQTIDRINSTVQQQGTNINSVSTRVQTAEGNISTVQNNITGLQSSQKQTADGLSQEVSDRKSGDSTVLQQGKDFTTSQVSNSETNMKSLINQKADSAAIGVIKDDVSSLKSQVNWQQVTFDDMNYLNTTGNYLITGGKGTNSPFTPWFYITVDAPRTDRITQTAWKDSNSNIAYKRSLFETTWSAWSQVVSSETLLSIFHDSWSLGTSTNDGITKQMITGIMGQPDGTLILKGNSLILDGNTTVTGDFYAKGGNFKNLNASNLTVGTLNGNQVNITNINASNIVSGSISGANLDINLNTGQVVFQHGRIYNTNFDSLGGVDINIDQSYISTKDYLGYSTLANGGLYLSQTRLNDTGYKPYFSLDNNNTPFGTLGALLLGTNGVAIATEGNSMPTIIGKEIYNGLLVTKGKQTVVAGASNGVMISGGSKVDSLSPFINVGATDMIAGTGGNRVQVYAKYFHLAMQWGQTTSNAANMFIAQDGAIVRSSSSSKYKLDIEYEQQAETANRLLTLDPATWHDKFESEQLDKFHEIGVDPERTIDMSNRRYYGIIAEDLVKAGLEHLVSRNVETGEVEGVEYSKIGVALIPIIRDLRNRLNDQNVEIERLKEKIK